MSEKIVVCGAAGFVGGRLVKTLWDQGYRDIRAVSSRPIDDWLYLNPQVDNRMYDLRNSEEAFKSLDGARWVYNLAAKVGGIGYIQTHPVDCLLSAQINLNLLRAASLQDTAGYFFASSACLYDDSNRVNPVEDYAHEKLFSERVCTAFAKEKKLPVKIARYQNIYGEGDNTKGAENRDHAPAALCRKIVRAKLSGIHEINIWGDGSQIRNFVHVDDVVEATIRIMGSGNVGPTPVDVGGPENISINQLVDLLEEIAAVKLVRFYGGAAPRGVSKRVCDNAYLRAVTNWTPQVSVIEGFRRLYNSIWEQEAYKK